MEKAICIEKREKVSDKSYFNIKGAWIPRLIIWPEYNGCYKDTLKDIELGDKTDEEWGQIISNSFKIFLERHKLQYSAFIHNSPTFFQKIFKQSFKTWKLTDRYFYLSSEEISEREHQGHDYIKYLLHNQELTKDEIEKIESAEILDRKSLLPYGKVIFELGIEEAVLEMSFLNFEKSFIEILQQECKKQGYKLKINENIFLSHWVIANKKEYEKKYDPSWDKL